MLAKLYGQNIADFGRGEFNVCLADPLAEQILINRLK